MVAHPSRSSATGAIDNSPGGSYRHWRHTHTGRSRVEDGRGSLGHAATLRLPSPLIEPDVPISGIRLSDWLHREAHGRSLTTSVIGAACFFLRLTVQLSLKGLDPSRCLQALPITFTSPSSKTRQKSGSFPPPALPGLNSHTTLSDPRLNRRLTATLRPLPSPKTGLP
jgi:hypothetical protein